MTGNWDEPQGNAAGEPQVRRSALLACPFCGSDDVGPPFDDRQSYWMTCHNCAADGPLVRGDRSDQRARELWNKRQPNGPANRPEAK